MKTNFIIMNREKIYNEIWQVSLTGVARKYNLNYAKLVRVCKEYDIPYPTSAYWNKKNMGLDVNDDVVPLPESNVKEIKLFLKEDTSTIDDRIKVNNDAEKFVNEFEFLSFLDPDERGKVAKVVFELDIDKHKKLHKTISNYKNKIKEDRKEERQKNYFNPYYNIHNYVETGYFANVSKLEKERCMKILSSIYYAIEELGGKINEDFSMKIRDELVTIEIEELKDQINHELTKEEAQKLLEYEENKKRNQYAYKPNIRKYDYIYNGKLKITFENRNYIKETDKLKLSEKLSDIIIKLYEKSEKIRIERTEREERIRKEREEEQRKEEIKNRKKRENEKVKELVNIAEDYRIACEIRNYINALSAKNNLDEETKKWIEWANRKADWFDPIIDANDEILGPRNHKESKENKEQNTARNYPYYNWY